MPVHSPRKQPRRHCTNRLLIKVTFLIWGVTVCGCIYLMLSKYSKVMIILPTTFSGTEEPPSVSSTKARTNSSHASILENPATVGTQQQHSQKLEAARQNQAWMLQKFQRGDPASSLEHNTDPEGRGGQQGTNGIPNESRGFQRPNWLDTGAQNQVFREMNDDQMQDSQCKAFNHTVLNPTHGCQANTNTRQVYCNFLNLRIDNSLITMDQGGERLETVMGRKEEDELPRYEKGAFSVRRRPKFEVPAEQRVGIHFMEEVLNNLIYPTKKNKGKFDSSCVETRPGTTLMITRYEYVNLYHTLTDWWNTFLVLVPEQIQRKEKIKILFLDGHPQGNLDSVWQEVFGPFEYVKQLPPHGVCFERAVFIPPGYSSTIFPDIGRHFPAPRMRCPRPKIADAFSSFFLKAYGLETITRIPGKVVIIDRQPYISHPRSNPDNFGRQMNLEDLEKRLRKDSKATSVEIVRFETLTFAEQVTTVRQAHILIGNHGAGISNLIFMDKTAHVLEFTVDYRDFFIYLAEWKGIHHLPIPIIDENRLSEMDLTKTVNIVNELMG